MTVRCDSAMRIALEVSVAIGTSMNISRNKHISIFMRYGMSFGSASVIVIVVRYQHVWCWHLVDTQYQWQIGDAAF